MGRQTLWEADGAGRLTKKVFMVLESKYENELYRGTYSELQLMTFHSDVWTETSECQMFICYVGYLVRER